MSKSGKNAYFPYVFANNFFGTFFKHFFNGFEISVKFCIFLIPFKIFSKKQKFFSSYWYFFQTLKPNAQEMAQKNGKPFFYKHVLEFSYATINRLV